MHLFLLALLVLAFLPELVLTVHERLSRLELIDVLGDVLGCAMIHSSGVPILVLARLPLDTADLLHHVEVILIAHLVETLLHFYFVGSVHALLLEFSLEVLLLGDSPWRWRRQLVKMAIGGLQPLEFILHLRLLLERSLNFVLDAPLLLQELFLLLFELFFVHFLEAVVDGLSPPWLVLFDEPLTFPEPRLHLFQSGCFELSSIFVPIIIIAALPFTVDFRIDELETIAAGVLLQVDSSVG